MAPLEIMVRRPIGTETLMDLHNEAHMRQLVDDLDNGGGWLVFKDAMEEGLQHPRSTSVPDESNNKARDSPYP